VTSPTGAAIQDFLNVTGRRSPLADIAVYPVAVQGPTAPGEIAHALRRLNQTGDWDVIVVARGGGSLEDLWAFNEEVVARAIAASRIPVVSAVGHEVDYTIADFVADLRAETPTAAAELVVRDRRDLCDSLRSQARLMAGALQERLGRWRQRLERCVASPRLQQPRRVFEPLAQRLDDLRTALAGQVRTRFRLGRERLRGLAAELTALSPLAVLSRGYALVYRLPDRKLVRAAAGLSAGDEIEIALHQGQVRARVETTENRKSRIENEEGKAE